MVCFILVYRDGLADIDFIKKHVQGYDQLVNDVLLDFTLEKAAELCGVRRACMTGVLPAAYAKAKVHLYVLAVGCSCHGMVL